MLKEAADFREDSDALAAILEPLDDAAFEQETLVNRWTISDVLVHLHVFNLAADMTLDDGQTVRLKSGDVVVQRGTIHNWVNNGTEPCIMAYVLIAAPLPAGLKSAG